MYSVESSRCVVTRVRCYVSEAAFSSILLLISLAIPRYSVVHVRRVSGYRKTETWERVSGVNSCHIRTNFSRMNMTRGGSIEGGERRR